MELELEVAGLLRTLRRFLRIAGGYWRGPGSGQARALALALLALNAAEVMLLLRLNHWNRMLFDALEARDAQAVLLEFGVLALLVASFASLSCLHVMARRQLALGWRAWLAQRLTQRWLAAGAPAKAPGNADGRIAEDARIATEEAVEMASSLSHAGITLGCFVGVLWVLSGQGPLVLWGTVLEVPGYLLWLAVLYACIGIGMASLLGRPLARETNRRQTAEAEFRAALLGEADSGRLAGAGRLAGLFGLVGAAFTRQSRAVAQLQLFCVGNTRFGAGLPLLAATPAYLAGTVSLGWVMQAAQAFQEVAGALNWPADNMPRIAQWRASVERVLALHAATARVAMPVAAPAGAAVVPAEA